MDVVIGPTAKQNFSGVWVVNDRYSEQIKFEHSAYSKIKLLGIMPADDGITRA